jgi:cytoskeletal protein RodZ
MERPGLIPHPESGGAARGARTLPDPGAMPTIGQKLEETRLSRGLSVEDVAHATRIHPNMILSIEEDDFSRFPSVAYAKSFIRKYGDHLGLDLSEAMDALNSGVTRFGENEFLIEMKRTIKKDRRFRLERFGKTPRLRPARKRGRPLFLNLILGTLIAAIGIFYFLGYNAPNAQKAKEEIARGLGLPLPAPAPGGEGPIETNPLKSSLPAEKEPAAATAPAIPPSNAGTVAVNAPPAAPGTPPVYPVLKEAVEVKLEETPVDPALKVQAPVGPGGVTPATALKPRSTPALDLGSDTLNPPPIVDLPKSRPAAVEPQALLRPEGTDPAATTLRQPESPTNPAQPKPASPTAPIRAEPVAESR